MRRVEQWKVAGFRHPSPASLLCSECHQGQDLQSFLWTEAEINERLERLMVRAFQEVSATARERDVDLRTAALMRAVARVAEAIMILGISP